MPCWLLLSACLREFTRPPRLNILLEKNTGRMVADPNSSQINWIPKAFQNRHTFHNNVKSLLPVACAELTVTHAAPNPVIFYAAISDFLVLRVRAE